MSGKNDLSNNKRIEDDFYLNMRRCLKDTKFYFICKMYLNGKTFNEIVEKVLNIEENRYKKLNTELYFLAYSNYLKRKITQQIKDDLNVTSCIMGCYNKEEKTYFFTFNDLCRRIGDYEGFREWIDF